MTRVPSITALAFAAILPSAGLGDEYDTSTVFQKGAWHVELTHDTQDGRLWCSAATSNNRGQTFSLTAYQNAQLRLFVFDDSWNIAPRSVHFIVYIDNSYWTVDGSGEDISISVNMTEPEKAVKFLGDLMGGNGVTVLNSDERRLAEFSLSGSYAAITNLFECWDRITEQDPFTDRSDPFGASSDPF